jgi:hypothetical protein
MEPEMGQLTGREAKEDGGGGEEAVWGLDEKVANLENADPKSLGETGLEEVAGAGAQDGNQQGAIDGVAVLEGGSDLGLEGRIQRGGPGALRMNPAPHLDADVLGDEREDFLGQLRRQVSASGKRPLETLDLARERRSQAEGLFGETGAGVAQRLLDDVLGAMGHENGGDGLWDPRALGDGEPVIGALGNNEGHEIVVGEHRAVEQDRVGDPDDVLRETADEIARDVRGRGETPREVRADALLEPGKEGDKDYSRLSPNATVMSQQHRADMVREARTRLWVMMGPGEREEDLGG